MTPWSTLRVGDNRKEKRTGSKHHHHGQKLRTVHLRQPGGIQVEEESWNEENGKQWSYKWEKYVCWRKCDGECCLWNGGDGCSGFVAGEFKRYFSEKYFYIRIIVDNEVKTG